MSGSFDDPAHDLTHNSEQVAARVHVTSDFITAQDGLRLHVRTYDPANYHPSPPNPATHDPMPDAAAHPLLCLPGLTRNADEFDAIARMIAGDAVAPRRVLAMDYRGRGRSQRDPNPLNYNVPMEAADVLAALDALDIARVIVLGSSRGGLIAMHLGLTRPTVLAGIVFNDIGPIIELEGLLRIKSYAGKLKPPRDLDEAVAQQKVLFGAQFPGISEDDWRGLARRAWQTPETAQDAAQSTQDAASPGASLNMNTKPALVPTCDPMVAAGLMMLNAETKLPPAWDAFDALQSMPLMVIRGEHSDLLSRTTVEEMQSRRPDMIAIEIEGQGHTPLLNDTPTITNVAAFVARCDFAPHT